MRNFLLTGLAFVLFGVACSSHHDDDPCPGTGNRGTCIEVVAYAMNAGEHVCCMYPTACDVPSDFKIFTSEEQCIAAAAANR